MKPRGQEALNAGLTFWQNTVSIHQADLMRSLAERAPGPVTVVAEAEVSEHRSALGWGTPHYGNAHLVTAPSEAERRGLEGSLSNGGVHIFSGLNAYPGTKGSLHRILARRTEAVGVFLEPWDPDGPHSLLRRARYTFAARRLKRDVSVLLTTGPLGRLQYQQAGFAPDQIVDFGYFVAADDSFNARGVRTPMLRIVYVGALSRRKRVDLLIAALGQLRGAEWRLDIVGDGPDQVQLREMASRLGLSEHVTWHGARPNVEARGLLGQADVLVLPSRFDGWGAVVNEALLAGARVIVSESCGAVEVAKAAGGLTFPSGDLRALTAALEASLHAGPLSQADRAARRKWAAGNIAADVAAAYLLAALRQRLMGASAPQPPWRASTLG